jgi:hypothetical protein
MAQYAGGIAPNREHLDYTKGADTSTCKECGTTIYDSDKESHIRSAHPSLMDKSIDKHFVPEGSNGKAQKKDANKGAQKEPRKLNAR